MTKRCKKERKKNFLVNNVRKLTAVRESWHYFFNRHSFDWQFNQWVPPPPPPPPGLNSAPWAWYKLSSDHIKKIWALVKRFESKYILFFLFLLSNRIVLYFHNSNNNRLIYSGQFRRTPRTLSFFLSFYLYWFAHIWALHQGVRIWKFWKNKKTQNTKKTKQHKKKHKNSKISKSSPP